MHIETDIYDDNDNFIYRRIISESGQALNITGLQEQTHYNVRSRKIDNNLVSEYSYTDFTTNSLLVPFMFYLENIDFGNNWTGTLYAKNLITNQRHTIATNVTVLNNWINIRTSSNGRYIFYHRMQDGNRRFEVKDLQSGELIYHVIDNVGVWFWANWKANSNDEINSFTQSGRRYTISTNTLQTGYPNLGDGANSGIILNDINSTCVYDNSSYSYAIRRRNASNGQNFAFIDGGNGYYKRQYVISEEEDFVLVGGFLGGAHRYHKVKISDWSVTPCLDYANSSGFHIHGLQAGHIIDREMWCIGINNTLYSLYKFNIDTNNLVKHSDQNDLYYLCDVNTCNPNWFS